jgi:hypothetical protein
MLEFNSTNVAGSSGTTNVHVTRIISGRHIFHRMAMMSRIRFSPEQILGLILDFAVLLLRIYSSSFEAGANSGPASWSSRASVSVSASLLEPAH